MGLDMYLVKRPKVKDEEVCYWRKANAIHYWFVRNVMPLDNCEECTFGKETLEALMKDCEAVIKGVKMVPGKVLAYASFEMVNGELKETPHYEDGFVIGNPEVCEAILPSRSGFFFGDTAYNQYYLDQIQYTYDKCKEALETTDFEKYDLVYSAWW